MDSTELTTPLPADPNGGTGSHDEPHAVTPSLVPTAGEHCPSCGAPMAPDQRYCVECGERRGEPRLPFMDGRPRRESEAQPAPKRSRGPRMSGSTTLIAGVGTLLLAMGTGVLIGRSGDHATKTAGGGVQYIAAPSGTTGAAVGATGASATSAAAGGKSGGGSKKKSHGGGSHSGRSGTSTQAKTPKQKLPPPVVHIGSPGHGRGYKHGKFTGDFFGP